jgi:hypothetical protein
MSSRYRPITPWQSEQVADSELSLIGSTLFTECDVRLDPSGRPSINVDFVACMQIFKIQEAVLLTCQESPR